jgi:hypothetical protein
MGMRDAVSDSQEGEGSCPHISEVVRLLEANRLSAWTEEEKTGLSEYLTEWKKN